MQMTVRKKSMLTRHMRRMVQAAIQSSNPLSTGPVGKRRVKRQDVKPGELGLIIVPEQKKLLQMTGLEFPELTLKLPELWTPPRRDEVVLWTISRPKPQMFSIPNMFQIPRGVYVEEAPQFFFTSYQQIAPDRQGRMRLQEMTAQDPDEPPRMPELRTMPAEPDPPMGMAIMDSRAILTADFA